MLAQEIAEDLEAALSESAQIAESLRISPGLMSPLGTTWRDPTATGRGPSLRGFHGAFATGNSSSP